MGIANLSINLLRPPDTHASSSLLQSLNNFIKGFELLIHGQAKPPAARTTVKSMLSRSKKVLAADCAAAIKEQNFSELPQNKACVLNLASLALTNAHGLNCRASRLKVVRATELSLGPSLAGRMVITGTMAEICAELDRMTDRQNTVLPIQDFITYKPALRRQQRKRNYSPEKTPSKQLFE